MTKTEAISLTILELINSGLNPVDALRAVCGAEVVDDAIGELYDALRAKAGK